MRNFGLWMALAAAALLPASAAPAAQAAAQPELAQFEAIVEQLRARLLRPGERVAGWDRGGANPEADVRARGADRHYLLTTGDDGTTVGILTGRPIADFAPAGWRVVDSYGSSSTPLDSPEIDFVPMSHRYVLALRTQFRRRGGVDCTSGITNALLYELPDAAAAPDDATIPLMFRMLILALEGQEMCVRSEGDAARGYRGRTFLPDGRELPELSDPGDLTTIVPAAPLDRLLRWRESGPRQPAPEG